MPVAIPVSSIDPWRADTLVDPFAAYAKLRALGPAVRLERRNLVALTRFDEVRMALADHETFASGAGVAYEPDTNALIAGGVLASDPPAHTAARGALSAEFSPGRTAAIEPDLRQIAFSLVGPLTTGDEFDAVLSIANPYVATIVSRLAGLPSEWTADLPQVAARAFNIFGPASEEHSDGLLAFQTLGERMMAHTGTTAGGTPDPVEFERIGTYMFPGVDTSVQAVTAALYLFAKNPDQWDILRADPSLTESAIREILRLHSPVRHFLRTVTRDCEIGNVRLEAGTRVLVMYGCANRDETKFPDPDTFNVQRQNSHQLAFGHGVHHCVGASLARRELSALLDVLREHVTRLELRGVPIWSHNLSIHGFDSLPLSLTA